MIADKDAIELYRKCQKIRARYKGRDRDIYSQFFRGKLDSDWENHHPGGCKRDMTVFRRFNVIPEYCFDCYKVVLEPATVVEIFKIMMLFERMDFPQDNTRKCMVEIRPEISGTYKGLVYCRGLAEGKHLETKIREAVYREISESLPVYLKRGCSEYALSYPDYAYQKTTMATLEYRPEWRVYENMVDSNFVIDRQSRKKKSNNHATYTLRDADTMFYWLKYAATIGDSSYLAISREEIAPFGWQRPSPFRVTDNK